MTLFDAVSLLPLLLFHCAGPYVPALATVKCRACVCCIHPGIPKQHRRDHLNCSGKGLAMCTLQLYSDRNEGLGLMCAVGLCLQLHICIPCMLHHKIPLVVDMTCLAYHRGHGIDPCMITHALCIAWSAHSVVANAFAIGMLHLALRPLAGLFPHVQQRRKNHYGALLNRGFCTCYRLMCVLLSSWHHVKLTLGRLNM